MTRGNVPVRHQIRVACPLDHAFATFTERIDDWWPRSHRRLKQSRLTLQPEAGGRIFERDPEGQEVVQGEVLRWLPPVELAYAWRPGAPAGLSTLVEIEFVADGDHTVVLVAHSEGDSGFGETWPERCGIFDRSWTTVLAAYQGFAASDD